MDNRPTLVFGDMHLPFAVDGWLEFLQETHKKYNCKEEVICVGDAIDLHQYSFHTSETDALTGVDEFQLAFSDMSKLAKAFPRCNWILGNHDLIMIRRIADIGLDARFLRTMHEMFDLPSTWIITDDIVVDDVLYRHAGQVGGKNGALNSAVVNMMSTVVGHTHSQGGVAYVKSPMGKTIFGMCTGALVDDTSYAVRYAKNAKSKSILGCGLVYDSTHATFIPL